MGLFELIYLIGHKFKTSRDLRNQKSLPAPVVSVGNLSTGGTGKTPLVIAIAQEAVRRGFFPCVLTRGYRGRAKGPVIVGRGDGPLMNYMESGDEPFLMADKLRGSAMIVKSADRYGAGLLALREMPEGSRPVFILDDGFQHGKLKRDMDILILDASDFPHAGYLLPVGNLREPFSSVGRADIIVITRKDDVGAKDLDILLKKIKKHNTSAPIYYAEHAPESLRTPLGAEASKDAIAGERVFAFSGIGSPWAFEATLKRMGLNVKGHMHFRDHHAYTQTDINKIARAASKKGAGWIITTEKDIIKIRGAAGPENLLCLGINIRIDEGFYGDVFGPRIFTREGSREGDKIH